MRYTNNIPSVKRILLRRSGTVHILRSRSHMGVSFHLIGRGHAPQQPQHGDRKGPPGPTQPPSPLLYDVGAAKPVYSSGEGGAMGMGGPLRSPCWWLYLNSIGPCGCQAP